MAPDGFDLFRWLRLLVATGVFVVWLISVIRDDLAPSVQTMMLIVSAWLYGSEIVGRLGKPNSGGPL